MSEPSPFPFTIGLRNGMHLLSQSMRAVYAAVRVHGIGIEDKGDNHDYHESCYRGSLREESIVCLFYQKSLAC